HVKLESIGANPERAAQPWRDLQIVLREYTGGRLAHGVLAGHRFPDPCDGVIQPDRTDVVPAHVGADQPFGGAIRYAVRGAMRDAAAEHVAAIGLFELIAVDR